jgi:hypothetical protein
MEQSGPISVLPTIEWDPSRQLWADVNRWHPLTDVAAYAAANKLGLIGVKVAEGSTPGKGGAETIAAAEAHGLMVVGYQFGAANPEAFLALFPPKPGRIPCLDFEGSTATVELASAWIQKVRAAYGRAPWFYAGNNWTGAGSPVGTPMQGCPWWGPQYGPHLRVLRGVGKPVAWQYAGGQGGPDGAPTHHPGIAPGQCDMNCLLVSRDELLAMAGLPVSQNVV